MGKEEQIKLIGGKGWVLSTHTLPHFNPAVSTHK